MTDRVEWNDDGTWTVVPDKEFEDKCPKCDCLELTMTRKMEVEYVEESTLHSGIQKPESINKVAARAHSNGTRFKCTSCGHNFNRIFRERA